MNNDTSNFMHGDAVYYTGEKYKTLLVGKDGKPCRGWIHAPVLNEPGVFVVEFPDLKDGDFIIPVSHLTRARQSKLEKGEHGPEVRPRRIRQAEDVSST